MKSGTTTNHQQQRGNVNELTTPEMRQDFRRIMYHLDEHALRLSDHLDVLNDMRGELETARQFARCLLTNDPFEAWRKLARRVDTTSIALQSTKKTATSKAKACALETRQQMIEVKHRLENYAVWLSEFFSDMHKLESFETELNLIEDLQSHEPLESQEARKNPWRG